MTLRLTPATIIAAYDYLKTTAPFNKWKLPSADDLEFRVEHDKKRYGHCLVSTDKTKLPIIGISHCNTKTTGALIEVIAHEACHLKQFLDDGPRAMTHGPKFKALAARVCKSHGFNLKTF